MCMIFNMRPRRYQRRDSISPKINAATIITTFCSYLCLGRGVAPLQGKMYYQGEYESLERWKKRGIIKGLVHCVASYMPLTEDSKGPS